jgi:hypothetical protein
VLMPFGKHKGKQVRALPRDYLVWLETIAHGELRQAVRDALYGTANEPIPAIDIDDLVEDFETQLEKMPVWRGLLPFGKKGKPNADETLGRKQD